MLFLPALLLFVLGTSLGISAMPMHALPQKSEGERIILMVKYEGGMDHNRARGFWAPEFREHGFFNVTPSEKLNLDRKLGITRLVLWYMSAPIRMMD